MTVDEFMDVVRDHRETLDSNDFKGMYSRLNVMWLNNRLKAKDIGDFTSFLLDFGVNPLDYMENIPDLYFCEQLYDNTFVIPDNIEKIGWHSFDESQIENIIIGSSVRSIGECAFEFNKKLKTVEINGPLLDIRDSAFLGCVKLKNIKLPKTVQIIEGKVFSNCQELESMVIPDGVKQISYRLFDLCYSLEKVEIGGAVTEIQQYSFSNCRSLKKIIYNNNMDNWYNINKHPEWILDTPSFKVVCQDGEFDV